MIDPVDVKRSYRFEQGFTFELNLWGDSDELRQAFVDKRDAVPRLTAPPSRAVPDRLAASAASGAGASKARARPREQQAKMGETIATRFGVEVARADRAADDRRDRAAARRGSRRPTSLAHALHRPTRTSARATRTASRSATSGAALHRDFSQPARPRRDPPRRGRRRRAARLVQRRSASPRSRTAAARRSSAASSATSTTTYRGAVSIDLRALDQVLEVDRDVARGAHPGRHLRARARGPAPAARPDAAPLPAVVRVLDPRRLARDPIGRSLRDAAHAHRRLRRVDPRGHAARRVGEPAPARFGRGAVARPDAARLRGHRSASSPRRGCACRTGPTFRASATARFSTFLGGTEAARAIAQSGLHPANCRLARPARGAAHRHRRPRRHAPAPRVRVGRPPARRVDRPRGRVRARLRRAHRRRRDRRSADEADTGAREGAAGSWRNAFIRAPYTRDALVGLGMISETFETACTWDRFETLHENVTTAVLDTARGRGRVARGDHVPLHARVPRRPGAVLHRARDRHRAASSSRSGRRSRPRPPTRSSQSRRHDHAPPRGRARPPALVRPPATRAVRGRAPRRQGRDRPRRHPQPGRADRPMSDADVPGGDLRPGRRRVPVAVRGVRRVRPRQRPRAGHGARAHQTSSETGAWAALERGELTMDDFFVALEAEAAAAGFALDGARLMGMIGRRSARGPRWRARSARIRERGLRTAALTNNWPNADPNAPSAERHHARRST